MDERQIEQLARLVWMLRAAEGMPEWDGPGIIKKLREAAPTASAFDLARAAINLAENRDLRTPGLLPQPGAHWAKADGTKPARRGSHTMRCPEPTHEGERMPCQQCKAAAKPPEPDLIAALAAAIEAGKEQRRERDAQQRAREERTTP